MWCFVDEMAFALSEEIHHSRLGEVSMQRFDLSTKRYLLDK